MTFIYRFVRSIPYDHPVCFLDGHVKIFVSWMASLSRAPPSASSGASFFSFPGRDLVPGSFGLVPGSAFAFAFSALVSLCVRRQIHQVPAQVLLSTPSPSTSSVRRDLVPVSAFAFARSWAPPDQAPAVDNSKATAATESPLARAMFSSSSHSLAIKPARN